MLCSTSWGNSHSNRKGGLRQLLLCCYELFILAGECRCNSWAKLWRCLKDVPPRTWNAEVTYSFPVQTQLYSEGWRQLSFISCAILCARHKGCIWAISHPSPPTLHHLVENIALVNTYKHVIESRMHFFLSSLSVVTFSSCILVAWEKWEKKGKERSEMWGNLLSRMPCNPPFPSQVITGSRRLAMWDGWYACPIFLLSE